LWLLPAATKNLVPVSLLPLGLSLSIFLAVLAVGMGTCAADLRYLLARPSLLLRTELAMMVLGPVIAIAVCKLFDLHPAVVVALVTLSVAPVGALFAQAMLPLVAPGRGGCAHGLFFASTVLSVVLTPLVVEVINRLSGSAVHVSPLTVAQIAVGSILVPLFAGLAIGTWWPASRRWIAPIQKVSSLLLLVCGLVILALAWRHMGALFREGTVSAIVLITLLGLAAGHLLGGPDEDDRTVLAFATVSRHPGVAVAVASLTGEALAPLGVLLAVLVGELATIPYKQWRKRRLAAPPPTVHGPPTGAH